MIINLANDYLLVDRQFSMHAIILYICVVTLLLLFEEEKGMHKCDTLPHVSKCVSVTMPIAAPYACKI